MGKITGFMEYTRRTPERRPVSERINDYCEVYKEFGEDSVREQGARCMDCGVPFCHTGCPLNNIIPDWNDLVYRDRWREAIRVLHSTNNFPEFTGRICPAPCEAACVLGINEPPVTIKVIEKTIIERAFQEGWIKPEPPEARTGKRVAVVGSGPAGLAAAQQLNRAGHLVTVFEKADRIGGLLRYGIPDFKMEKHLIDRRVDQMRAEGVQFRTNAHVGKDVPVDALRQEFDAILLAGGAEQPRDLNVPGRELKGIHFAMDFLPQQNRRCAGDTDRSRPGDPRHRQARRDHRRRRHRRRLPRHLPPPEGALRPPVRNHARSRPTDRSPLTPWPLWPLQLRVESSHEEGGIRDWAIATTKFTGDANGNVKQLHATRVGPPPKFAPIPGTDFTIDADLVLLAMGFLGPVKNGMMDALGVKIDQRGNVATDDNYMSTVPGVFAAGDTRRGQSLVVWAIAEGRKAARAMDAHLMGETKLP